MKRHLLNILVFGIICSCGTERSSNMELTEMNTDSISQGLFIHEIRSTMPNIDTSFIFFRTMTRDRSLFMEIHYSKEPNERSTSSLYTKDFFGKTIDSSNFSIGSQAVGKPYFEVHEDRSIMLIDSMKMNLEPYWVEIKTEKNERVIVMCQADTTICCDTVIFRIDLIGKITCSNSLVKNPIVIN